MKKSKLIKIILIVIILLLTVMALTGCDRDVEKVSYNISKEADNFKVMRRIVFINLRTDTILFELTGLCSIDDNSSGELEVTCKTGPGTYQKHFLKKSAETTYTVEDLGENEVNKYKYTFYWKPEAIIPIEIKGE